MILGVNNPFRSSKWKHRSTTVEMKDGIEESNALPQQQQQVMNIAPPSPPDSSTTTNTNNHYNNNNNTMKKKKSLPPLPFNSDSLLNGIGDYIFQSPLGGGKFSKVMLSYHYLTGKKVAIKMINKKEHKYRVMSRLVREIAIMKVLDHPNIVRLYETYETADTLYIIMEYVPGYNLEEYLKSINNSTIPEHQARDIFRQVVKAVDHCHSKWIVHRDLKTPNILLTPDHQVKIADFGLGNRFGLQRLRTVCGSLLYYSPEIMTARSYVGPEVDSWCLGIMLYRMTAGLELFAHARTQPELRKLVINHRYNLPSRLSPELQNTIKKCLAVDRFDRLSLKSFLSNDPWFNDYGKLEDVFEDRIPNPSYHAHDVTEAYASSVRSEDNTRIQLCSQNSKRLHIQDLNEERRRGFKVQKTVIYHITNASTYYTGTAPHSSQHPIDLDAQKRAKAELHENILVTLKQVRLQQVHNVTDLKSPISHLFRKFKRTESTKLMDQHHQPEQTRQLRKAASALNLSQLYQRVTKDHISYFTIQCNIRTGSSTTVISGYSTSSTFASSSTSHTIEPKPVQQPVKQPRKDKRLSHRLSMVFFSNTQPEFNMSTSHGEYDPEQDKRNQSEMLRIIRMVCDILGITYYQASSTQLVCLLTLKNCKKSIVVPAAAAPAPPQPPYQHSLFRSKLFTSNDRLSDMNRNQRPTNSSISYYSTHSGSNMNNGWWSRQMHRLSNQFNSQSNMNNSTHILGASSHALGASSSHDLLNMGRTEQEQQILQQRNEDNNDNNDDQQPQQNDDSSDGFVTLSIDVSSIPSSKYNDDGTPVQIVALRYSKLKGSTKVFKLAKGWIQKILSQNDDYYGSNTKSSNNKYQQPPHMMNRYEAEAYYIKQPIADLQQYQFDEQNNDIIRL